MDKRTLLEKSHTLDAGRYWPTPATSMVQYEYRCHEKGKANFFHDLQMVLGFF